jgi:predicted nucleic acid-binding Zn ribbon protein
MAAARRGPRPLSSAFEALAQRLAPGTTLAQAQGAWREAVGPSIAERAWPVAERAGVLTISCESSVWAQELDLMGDAIRERLNERLQGGHIARLRCVATPPN